ncbi:ribonuclease HII [Nakamurella lactea]|uniref:ribonuclease HII n=1 Tax=Nakamurella lactea TaxID=459515 RepID=UPI000423DE2A|nr:ribonuclease HII [Nakamurella lactea]
MTAVAPRTTRQRAGGSAEGRGLHRPSLRFEKSLIRDGCLRLAAMDEVGRGALAGPVTIGIVVVTERIGRVPEGLRDSKLLTPSARERLVGPVRRWARGEFAVGHASAVEIDAIGIMAALRAAARRALAQLDPVDALLLDGKHNYLAPPDPTLFDGLEPGYEGDDGADGGPGGLGGGARDGCAGRPAELPVFGERTPPPVHLKVKADLTCAAVAGASVLAKTERDRLLTALDPYFPEYGFAVHKGYATPEHRAAIRQHGASVVHRRSWQLLGHDGRQNDGSEEEGGMS